jgi:hypothetical protein
MKKTLKRIWGIGLVVVLLSSLFIVAAPASAGNYAYTTAGNLPTGITDTILAPAAGFGILDVAQSGDTIWATGRASTTDYLYRSTNGGASWAKVTPTIAPAMGTWSLIAVAPDDPNVVAIVATANTTTNNVYLSNNGGVTFSEFTGLATGANINAISISPQGLYRYVAVGGHDGTVAASANNSYLAHWPLGALAPQWTALAIPAPVGTSTTDDVEALQYSTNWLADQSLLVVTETVGSGSVNGYVALRVYSYNTSSWDANVDISFPRMLESTSSAVLTCSRADITLDGAFFLGDEALQIGFVGAQITTTAEAGGLYRVGTYTVSGGVYSLSQIMDGTAINSVAWDGSNLMAAQHGTFTNGIPIWRCANALASVGWVIQPSSTFKTPGTGSGGMVLFAGEMGYAFSQGNNSAIAQTKDLGKTFNGIALVNSNFNNILDFWVSPDGSVTYAVTDDTVDINLWRKSAGAWQRVFILAGQTTTPWLVRADADVPNTVFLGKKMLKNMYYSVDGGTNWTVRSCSQNIADFAVQDKDIIYVAAYNSTNVAKTSNGGFTWGSPVNTGMSIYGGGTCYSISLLADNQILIGGTTGGVAYSADGNATWTTIPGVITSGQTLVAATGLAANDFIFAVSSGAAATVSSWKIGTNVIWSAGAAAAATGLAYENGILYVFDNTANVTLRFLYPTIVIAVATDSIAAGATNVDQTNMVNALQVSTGSEYFTSAAVTPTPTYPINNAKIPVNSLSGGVNNFVFQWSSPPAISTVQSYNYNLEIYLDAAGLIPVAGSATASVLAVASPAGGLSVASNGAPAFVGVPGETYYWRVRAASGAPLQSFWSAMQSFTIEQMTAIVPIVSSPVNGAEVDTTTPGFSWSPIAGATKYKFELSTNAAFVSTVYSTEVTTSGAMLPTTIALERGQQYFWRVKAIEPSEGEWSMVSNFIVAELPPEAPPPVVVQEVPAPVINIPAPPPAQEITLQPPAEEVIAPAYIWAIIIIGAVLVIAVIVLIVRTRRSV